MVSAGLTGVEASVLHNGWLGYERDWLPQSRGSDAGAIADAWAGLQGMGSATAEAVTDDGLMLRQRLEDDTDRLTTLPWQLLGVEKSEEFAAKFEPPCEKLLARVDLTAGPNYQPASRVRRA